MDTDTTNLVAGDDTASDDATVADDAGVAADDQTDDQQFDENGEPIDPPEPEDEEIDLDDLKLKVPKDQAQKVREALLRQADYTKKTQELSEGRKAFDQERQAFQQASTEELGAAAQAMSIAQQLDAYQRVDWDAWEAEDPFEAQKGFRQFQQLRDAHGQALGRMNQLRNARVSTAQQETAKRIEQTQATLAKEIPGWSPAVEAQVADFGMKGFGFTADEMADMKIDPRIAKAFHRLHTLEEQAKKTNKAQGHVAAQAVKPAAKVGGATSPPTGPVDRISTDEWMRRRNAQVRKRA